MSTHHTNNVQTDSPRQSRRLLWLLGCFAAFVLIAWQVQSDGPLVRFDLWLQEALQAVRSQALVTAAAWLTLLGSAVWATCIAVLISVPIILRRHWRALAGVWTAMIGAGLTILVLKGLIYRPRPTGLDDVVIDSSSFPSGNSIFAAALFGVVILIVLPQFLPHRLLRITTICVAMLPLFVAASRVILSVHYLSDTAAGLAIGFAWALIGSFLVTGFVPASETK